jgi:hypothetical protein
MARPCEVCEELHPESEATTGRARRILVEDRIVALCDEHAAALRVSGESTLAGLRALFVEPGGNRSLVPRRAPLDRRVFPPRPEGRRRSPGRRNGDAAED